MFRFNMVLEISWQFNLKITSNTYVCHPFRIWTLFPPLFMNYLRTLFDFIRTWKFCQTINIFLPLSIWPQLQSRSGLWGGQCPECSAISSPCTQQSISHMKVQELASPGQGVTIWNPGPLIALTILEDLGPFSNSTLFPPMMSCSPRSPPGTGRWSPWLTPCLQLHRW